MLKKKKSEKQKTKRERKKEERKNRRTKKTKSKMKPLHAPKNVDFEHNRETKDSFSHI